jgi:hypothetical protein
MFDKISSVVSRIFFAFAFFLLFIAFLDKFLGLFGWQLSWLPYEAGRLLEFSAILLIFVIALILRQMRELLKK